MELIEGNYYSPHDLQTFMEVSESTWSHRRNELLSNLSLYYDYEVEYEGRKTTFHILKCIRRWPAATVAELSGRCAA